MPDRLIGRHGHSAGPDPARRWFSDPTFLHRPALEVSPCLSSDEADSDVLTPEQVNALIDVGIAGLLIVGGFREWYVWGPAHRRQLAELIADRNFWRTQALRGTSLSEQAIKALVGDDEQEGDPDA